MVFIVKMNSGTLRKMLFKTLIPAFRTTMFTRYYAMYKW